MTYSHFFPTKKIFVHGINYFRKLKQERNISNYFFFSAVPASSYGCLSSDLNVYTFSKLFWDVLINLQQKFIHKTALYFNSLYKPQKYLLQYWLCSPSWISKNIYSSLGLKFIYLLCCQLVSPKISVCKMNVNSPPFLTSLGDLLHVFYVGNVIK